MWRKLLGTSRRLQTHLVLVFVGLFALIQIVAFAVMDQGRVRVASAHVAQQLDVGEHIFDRLLTQNREQLERAAGVLATDFGFREAIATNDLNTIVSVLRNHGDRIHADVMQLVSLDGRIVADTHGHRRPRDAFRFARMLRDAETAGKATETVVMSDGLAYQLVVVPVLAPDPIAWVAMAFLCDDRRARDLRDAMNLEVSFVRQEASGQWQVLASSFGRTSAIDFLKALEALPPATDRIASKRSGSLVAKLADGRYESRLVPLSEHDGAMVAAVLHRSLEAALRPFEVLGRIFFAIATLGLVLFVLGSVMVSGRIARPVNALAVLAKRIEEGDYTGSIQVESAAEIEMLAKSFDQMRKAVSEREDRILRLAYHDPLTGLANRARLMDRLEQLIALSSRERESVSVILMDLDRFKYVNDVLGHQYGDVVLQEVAERLTGLLRDSDTVARLGGDEFAVLLPRTSAVSAMAVASKITTALETPMVIEGQNVDIGASIGIATFPEHGANAAILLREADVAMYAAKRARAGVMVFDQRHSLEQQKQLSLLSDLRRAIEENQLVLHYQPKIDIETERVTGVEVLVRWQHPERGNIPPDQFIPFLEHSGHIRSLTAWVLRAGIRQIGKWNQEGKRLTASLNISARDLLNPELPGQLEQLLSENQVEPAQICLELTESALVEDPATALATIKRLHSIGVNLAIDDYGTGYSSLAYIQQLPVREVKIDRSFVMRMVESKDSRTIVRSTIELGHNLGMRVTAEGVEDLEALDMLRGMGCDTAQGYWFSKPLPAAEFDLWWAKHHPLPRLATVGGGCAAR
jgi:diguanylate cyclase (GGDEF)-like protein